MCDAAGNMGIGSEALVPDLFGDHRHGRLAGCAAIAAVDQSADDRAVQPFHAEKVAGDRDADAAAGIVVADRRGEITESGQLADGAGLVAQV